MLGCFRVQGLVAVGGGGGGWSRLSGFRVSGSQMAATPQTGLVSSGVDHRCSGQ